MKPSQDIPLNDIMPLVEVPDTSWYPFGGMVTLAIMVILGGIVWWKRRQKRLKLANPRHHHYDRLTHIDWSNPKRAAYTITQEGYYFSHDNDRTHGAYDHLISRLEPYKYAPAVDPIDAQTIGYYHLYCEMIDV